MQQIEKHILNKFPEMSKEHFDNLKNDIEINGYDKTFPIYLYENKIIDGWNRYKACKEINIEPNYKEFIGTKMEAIVFILRTNNRRDLTPYHRSIMALEYKPYFEEKAKENLKLSGGRGVKGCKISDKVIDTKKELAKIAKVSHDTIAKVKKIQEKAPEEIKAKLSTGEVSINAAYKEIKKEEKKEELAQIRIDIEKGVNNVDINNIPEKFDVIYADPPWRYDFSESSNRKIENHYTTMDNKDIANMKVPAKENCVLFMWATAPKLIEAIDVMKGWDFTYKTHAIWDKEKIGMGYWFRGQHELLMVGVKGKVAPPDASIRISSIIKEVRSKHSKKPNCVAEYIEIAFHNKSKIELFCREPRKGWYSYGNQI